MPRTTDSAVKAILDTQLNTMPFIQTASVLVTTYLVPQGLPESLLAEIECWLAAHLVVIREPRTHQTRLGETAITYDTPQLGLGLESTPYGQTVLTLDVSGTLATLAKAPLPASFAVD